MLGELLRELLLYYFGEATMDRIGLGLIGALIAIWFLRAAWVEIRRKRLIYVMILAPVGFAIAWGTVVLILGSSR